MIDKGLYYDSSSGEAYYFQLYPINLSIIQAGSELPAPGTTYKFSVYKVNQKFDENKLPIEANFKNLEGTPVTNIPRSPLNFYIQNYIKNRKVEFIVKLNQTEKNQQYDVGEQVLNMEPYIKKFKEENHTRFEEKAIFAEDYELEYELYIEKSRFALEKIVKEFKAQRTMKSPLKREDSIASSKKGSVTKPISFTKPVKIQQPPSNDKNQEIIDTYSIESIPDQKTAFQPVSADHHTESKSKASVNRPPLNYEKTKSLSSQSKDHILPLIATKFKQVSANGVSEIKIPSASKIGSQIIEGHENEKGKKEEQMQKLYMIVFLLVAAVVMYFSMHPNKKA